ncbi:MAG: sulfotransferase, partial [Rhodothermia bacterium]
MTVIQGSPIFVVGTGRSGSTIFHRLLCTHHKVAWLNRILSQ